MFCSNCGNKINCEENFCTKCGQKINVKTDDATSQDITKNLNVDDNISTSTKEKNLETSINESKTHKKFNTIWQKSNTFLKITIILTAISLVLLILSIAFGNTIAIVVSVIQTIGLIAALLVNQNIIRLSAKWLKYVLLIVSVILMIFNTVVVCKSIVAENNPVSEISLDKYNIVTTVKTPYSSDECLGENYLKIKKAFSTSGFTDISIKTVEDVNIKDSKLDGTIFSISINGSDFTSNQEFDSNSKIIITCHMLKSYKVNIHVNFIPNLIFSQYNVEMTIGDKKETLMHGTDEDYEYYLKAGEYRISFCSSESSTVKGEIMLNVTGEINAAYTISCFNDRIAVEKDFVENKGDVGENQIMMSSASSDYLFMDYNVVIDDMKKAGFINIKTTPAYDIILGITNEGEVKSISVNGSSSFNRGDIFDSNAEIVIAYHMKEEDNPSNKTTTTVTSESTGVTEEAETLNGVVLPKATSKLGKDYDTTSSETVYYINVDGNSNIPKLVQWNSTTVTDGVADYLNNLKSLGYSIKTTKSSSRSPYNGFTIYETYFEVSNSKVTWNMYLSIQDEKYVEYELDINTH